MKRTNNNLFSGILVMDLKLFEHRFSETVYDVRGGNREITVLDIEPKYKV